MDLVALILVLPSVGPTELLILLAIILLLFGAKRIPELARGLGNGIREFRKGTRGEGDEVRDKEKKDEELTAGAGEDTHNARVQEEEAARAERAGERPEQQR
jgi:sec-independent protein translocase protein TatA